MAGIIPISDVPNGFRERTNVRIFDHGPSGSFAALDVETDGRRAASITLRGAVESIY